MPYGKPWALGPFTKDPRPILEPNPASSFLCPVSGRTVAWESSNVFNPAAVMKDSEVHLFYRADDEPKRDDRGVFYTCRIGHARSSDGESFTRSEEPVLHPDNDFLLPYTWERGLWDPHILEDEAGTYYLYYNTDNGTTHRRRAATSQDRVEWRKHGSIFQRSRGEDHEAINGLVRLGDRWHLYYGGAGSGPTRPRVSRS